MIGIVKLFSGQITTNSTLQKWKIRPDATCPRCGEEIEDEMHVIRCDHPEATDKWKTKIRALQQWMEEEAKTHPSIADTICSTLCSWKLHKHQTPPANRDTREAFYEQTAIGWWNFMFGLHSNKWQTIQKAHYDRIGSKRSVKRWTSLLIRKLWDTVWDQWQHRCRIAHDTTDTQTRAAEVLDAQIRREAKPLVGFNGVEPGFLEAVGLQFVDQADAPPFLAQVNHDSLALRFDLAQGRLQLGPAVAAQ